MNVCTHQTLEGKPTNHESTKKQSKSNKGTPPPPASTSRTTPPHPTQSHPGHEEEKEAVKAQANIRQKERMAAQEAARAAKAEADAAEKERLEIEANNAKV